MSDFLSIIGTIASIGSIPLSIYIYMKTKEANLGKVRREIVKILLYQIGGNRQLSSFELETVINSKLRENKIKVGVIIPLEILEDLVSETISNPLLDDKRKEAILNNLKEIYQEIQARDKLFKLNEDINIDDKSNKEYSKQKQTIEEDLKAQVLLATYYKIKSREGSISSVYALISTILTVVISLLSYYISNSELKDTFGFTTEFKNNSLFINLTLGIIIALISAIIIIIIIKINNVRKNK